MVTMRHLTQKKISIPTIILLTIAVFLTFALLLPAVTSVITNIFSLIITALWIYLLFRIFLKGYRFVEGKK